jgi:hypothetical protein
MWNVNEVLSLPLRNVHILRLFEGSELRRVIVSSREKGREGWRKLHNKELALCGKYERTLLIKGKNQSTKIPAICRRCGGIR